MKAAQHAKDDILDLMFSKDPGLRQLGRKRFVQSAAYTIPPTAAANMLKLAMRGQSADPEDFQKSLLYAWVSNVYGIGGDVGAARAGTTAGFSAVHTGRKHLLRMLQVMRDAQRERKKQTAVLNEISANTAETITITQAQI